MVTATPWRPGLGRRKGGRRCNLLLLVAAMIRKILELPANSPQVAHCRCSATRFAGRERTVGMALAKGIQLARRVAIGAQFHRAKSIPVYSNLRIRWCSLHGPRYDQMRIRNVLPASNTANPGLHGWAKLVRLTATLLLDRPASPVLLELRTILGQGYLDPARWHCRLGSQTRSRRPLRFAYGHAAVAPERGGMPCLTRSSMSANLPAMVPSYDSKSPRLRNREQAELLPPM